MAETERELLKKTIDAIRRYDQDERSPYSIEYFLLRLNDADRSNNAELWKQLRTTLAESDQVNREATKKFLRRKYFAKEGYWWWDPENWQD